MDQFKDITEDLIKIIEEKQFFKDFKSLKEKENILCKTIIFDIDFSIYLKKYEDIFGNIVNSDYLENLIDNSFFTIFNNEEYNLNNLNYAVFKDYDYSYGRFVFEIEKNDSISKKLEDIIFFINFKLEEKLFKTVLKIIESKDNTILDEEDYDFIIKIKQLINNKNDLNNDYKDTIQNIFIKKLKENFEEETLNILRRSDAFLLTKDDFVKNFSKLDRNNNTRLKIPKDGISNLESVCNKIKTFDFIEDVKYIDKKYNIINITTKNKIKEIIKNIERESINQVFLELINKKTIPKNKIKNKP